MKELFEWQLGYAAETLEGDETKLHVFIPQGQPLVQEKNIKPEPEAYKIEKIPTNGGKDVGGTINLSAVVPCEWHGEDNRTCPRVHIRERVWVSQIDDGEWIWRAVGDTRLRKKDYVRFYIPDKKTQNELPNDDNCHWIEFDSRDDNNCIHIKTADSDGEDNRWSIKLDMDKSELTIDDGEKGTGKNKLKWISADPLIRLENRDGSSIELNKKDINAYAPGNINLEAGENITTKSGNDTAMEVGNNWNVEVAVGTGIKTPVTKWESKTAHVLKSPAVGIDAEAVFVVKSPVTSFNSATTLANGIFSCVNALPGTLVPMPPKGITMEIPLPEVNISAGSATGTTKPEPAIGDAVVATPPSPATAAEYPASYEDMKAIVDLLIQCLEGINSGLAGPGTVKFAGLEALKLQVEALLVHAQVNGLQGAKGGI